MKNGEVKERAVTEKDNDKNNSENNQKYNTPIANKTKLIKLQSNGKIDKK